MTVAELIEELKRCDPCSEVKWYDGKGNSLAIEVHPWLRFPGANSILISSVGVKFLNRVPHIEIQ